jgi:hypothetical protein
MSKEKVIESLNATLKSLQAARDSIPTTAVNYERIAARHDEIVRQIEDLRDSYGRPYEMTPDEIILNNIQQALRMTKSGMSPEAVSKVFEQDGINFPVVMIQELSKPGAIIGLLGGQKKD